MIQEFQANVEKLFLTMVPVGDTGTYDIDKLITILRRRATRPIRIDVSEDSVRLTYYNVTIVIARDLASMQIVYNSDYQLTLRHIACADPYRLADFIGGLAPDVDDLVVTLAGGDQTRSATSRSGNTSGWLTTAFAGRRC